MNQNDSAPRSLISALGFSAVAIAAVLTFAVMANLALGRVIHWDIVSVLGAIGLVFLTIGRKFRTI